MKSLILIICSLLLIEAIDPCPPSSASYFNMVPLTLVSSYYNRSITEDVWIYVTNLFYLNYFTTPTTMFIILPELASPAPSSFCAGLSYTIDAVDKMYSPSYFSTSKTEVCGINSVSIKALVNDEWTHIVKIFSGGKLEYYINKIHVAPVSHSGCRGDKYLLSLSSSSNSRYNGIVFRNYRVWSAKVDLSFIRGNFQPNSQYSTLPPRHYYKLDEFVGEVIDYGESGLNILVNDIASTNTFEEFSTMHNSFPYSNNFTQNSSLLHNGAVYMKDGDLLIPNVMSLIVPTTKQMTLSFMFKFDSSLTNGMNAQLIKSYIVINTIETDQLSINASLLNTSAYVMMNDAFNNNTLTNDLMWKSIAIVLSEDTSLNSDGENVTTINVELIVDNNILSPSPSISPFFVDGSLADMFTKNSLFALTKFNGYARELKVWSRILSTEELIAHYYNYDKCNSIPYLIAYWPFNSTYSNYSDNCELFTLNTTQNGVNPRNITKTDFTVDPIYFNNTNTDIPRYYYSLYKYKLAMSLPSSTEPITISWWIHIRDTLKEDVEFIDNKWKFVVSKDGYIYATCSILDFLGVDIPEMKMKLAYGVWNYLAVSISSYPEFTLYYEKKGELDAVSKNFTGSNINTVTFGSDISVYQHYITARDVHIWSEVLTYNQIAEAKYGYDRITYSDKIFALYTMEFKEFGSNGIIIPNFNGTLIIATPADLGDTKVPHYSLLRVCPLGHITNGIECIKSQKVLFANKWIKMFTFDPAQSLSLINKAIDFWVFFYSDVMEAHFFILRDLNSAPISGIGAYNNNKVAEMPLGIYFAITTLYDGSGAVKNHSVVMKAFTSSTALFNVAYNLNSKISNKWVHCTLISSNQEATNVVYALKFTMHDDTGTIISDSNLEYKESTPDEITKYGSGVVSMLINPQVAYFREVRVRAMAYKMYPTISAIMADSHIYASNPLFYMPLDDGIGKSFRSPSSPSIYFNYSDAGDYMVWIPTPNLLIVCKDSSYSYGLNKCAHKKAVYFSTDNTVLNNALKKLDITSMSTAGSQDFSIGMWIMMQKTPPFSNVIMFAFGTDTSANLNTIVAEDHTIAKLVCNTGAKIELVVTVPSNSYKFEMPLNFQYHMGLWNHYIIKASATLKSLIVNGMTLANLTETAAPITTFSLDVTKMNIPTLTDIYIKGLVINFNSTYPLSPINPMTLSDINYFYNMQFLYASYETDEDASTYVYYSLLDASMYKSSVDKATYDVSNSIISANDRLPDNSYIEINNAVNITDTLTYPIAAATYIFPTLAFDIWLSISNPMQLSYISTDTLTWDKTRVLKYNAAKVCSWVDNTWYHYQIVSNGASVDLYESMQLKATGLLGGTTLNTDLIFTLTQVTVPAETAGVFRFKEIRIFRRALSIYELNYYHHFKSVGTDTLILATIDYTSSRTYTYYNPTDKRQMISTLPSDKTYLFSTKNIVNSASAFMCSPGKYFNGVKCVTPLGAVFETSGTKNSLGITLPLNISIVNIKKQLEWTFEAWVFVNSSSAGFTEFTLIALQGKYASIALKINNTNKLYGKFDYFLALDMLSSTYVSNAWTHVAYTSKQILTKLYHTLYSNGASVANNNFSLPSARYSYDNVLIGNSTSTNYNIVMREAKVWNKMLLQEDIAKFMYSQLRTPLPNLLYYFPFDSKTYMDESAIGKMNYASYDFVDKKSQYDKIKLVDLSTVMPLLICDADSYYNDKAYKCTKYPEQVPNKVLLVQGYNLNITPPAYTAIDWTVETWLDLIYVYGSDSNIFEQRVCNESISLKRYMDQYSLLFKHSSNYNNSFIIGYDTNSWHHYAFAYSSLAQLMRVYLDGAKLSEKPMSIKQLRSCKIVFGEFLGTSEVAMKISEFRIWSQTRQGTDIRLHMNKRMDYIPELILYLKLNDLSDNITDYSSSKFTTVGNVTGISINAWIDENELKFCRNHMVYSKSMHSCTENLQMKTSAKLGPYTFGPSTIPISNEFTIGVWIRVPMTASITDVNILSFFNNKVIFQFGYDTGTVDYIHRFIFDSVDVASGNTFKLNSVDNWALIGVSVTSKITNPYAFGFCTGTMMQTYITGPSLYTAYTANSFIINPGAVSALSLMLRDLRIYDKFMPLSTILSIFIDEDKAFTPNMLCYMSFRMNTSFLEEVTNTIYPADQATWISSPLTTYTDVKPTKIVNNETNAIALGGATDVLLDMANIRSYAFSLSFWLRVTSYTPASPTYQIFEIGDVHSPYRRTDFYANFKISTALPSYTMNIWGVQDFTAMAANTNDSFIYFVTNGELVLGEWMNIGYTFTVGNPSAFKVYWNGNKIIFSTTSTVAPPATSVNRMCLTLSKYQVDVGKEIHYQINKVQAYDSVLPPYEFVSMALKAPDFWNEHLMYYLSTFSKLNYVTEFKRYIAIADEKYYPLPDITNDMGYVISAHVSSPSVFPTKFCSSTEWYSKYLLKCVTGGRRLRWLSGVTDSVNITIDKPEKEFSLEMWSFIYTQTSNTNMTLFSSPITSGTTSIIIHYNTSDNINVALDLLAIGNYSQYTNLLTAYTNSWHHYAISYNFMQTLDKTNQSLFHINRCIFAVDGMQQLLVPIDLVTTANPNPILSTVLSVGSKTFTGSIAELRVWKKFRSAGFIGYQMRSKLNIDNDQQYISYMFPLNESEGLIIEESFGKTSAINITTTAIGYTNPIWQTMPTELKVCDSYYNDITNECKTQGKRFMDPIQTYIFYTTENYAIQDYTICFWILDKTGYSFSVQNSQNIAMVNMNADSSTTLISVAGVDLIAGATPFDTWRKVTVGFKASLLNVMLSYDSTITNKSITADVASKLYWYSNLGITISTTYVRKLSIWNKFIMNFMKIDNTIPDRNGVYDFSPLDYYSLIAYFPLDEYYESYIRDISRCGDSQYFSTVTWGDPIISKYMLMDVDCRGPSKFAIMVDATKVCKQIFYADPTVDTLTCSNTQLYSLLDAYQQVKTDNKYCMSCINGYLSETTFGTCVDSCPLGSDPLERMCLLPLNTFVISNTSSVVICMNGTTLVNGQCIAKCDAGYYLISNISTNQLQCATAHQLHCLVIDEKSGSPLCTQCEDGYLLKFNGVFNDPCYPASECSNTSGSKKEYMECFDRNTINGDGCTVKCKIEPHYSCTQVADSSVCFPTPGDGYLYKPEVCDFDLSLLTSPYKNCNCDGTGCSIVSPAVACNWINSTGTDTNYGYAECFFGGVVNSVVYTDYNYITLIVTYSVNIIVTDNYTSPAILCRKLFNNDSDPTSSYLIMGNTPNCTVGNKSLTITLGVNNTVASLGYISFINSTILIPSNPATEGVAVQRTINLPEIPKQTVSASIVFPSASPKCEDLVFTVYGINGLLSKKIREISMSCSYIYTSSTMETTSETFIQSFTETGLGSGTYTLLIDSVSLISNTSYSCHFVLTSWLGDTFIKDQTVNVNSSSVPQISFDDATSDIKEVRVSDIVSIKANGYLVSCDNTANTPLNLIWVFDNSNDASISLLAKPSISSKILYIPPYTLKPGMSYQYHAVAAYNGSNYSKNLYINAVKGKIISKIDNGSAIDVGLTQSILISGYSSYDEDTFTNTGITYKWECKKEDLITSCSVYSAVNTPTLAIQASLLGIGKVFIKLTIAKDTRTATTYIQITTKTAPATKVKIKDISSSITEKKVTYSKYIYEAVVDTLNFGALTYSWTLSNTAGNKLTAATKFISIPPYTLTGGAYSLTCVVSDASNSASVVIGSATLSLIVNSGPTMGVINVSPNEGNAYSTMFSIYANNFNDADTPMTFKFSIKKRATDKYVAISNKRLTSSIITVLPEGDENGQNLLFIKVEVEDSYSAFTVCESQVRVNPTTTDLQSRYQSLMQIVNSTSDSFLLMNALNFVPVLISHAGNDSDLCGGCNPPNGYCNVEAKICVCTSNYSTLPDCSISMIEATQEKNIITDTLNKLTKSYVSINNTKEEDENIVSILCAMTIKELINTTDLISIDTVITSLLKSDTTRRNNGKETLSSDTLQNIAAIITETQVNQSAATMTNIESQLKAIAYSLAKNSTPNIDSISLAANYLTLQLLPLSSTVGITTSITNSLGASVAIDSAKLLGINSVYTAATSTESSSYALTVTHWNTSKYDAYSAYVRSGIMSISLMNLKTESEMVVASLTSPVQIVVPYYTYSNVKDIAYYKCFYYNGTGISESGITTAAINLSTSLITCLSNHLTDFMIGIPELNMSDVPKIPIITDEMIESYAVVISPAFWFTLIITVIMVVLAIWTIWKDKSDELKYASMYEHQKIIRTNLHIFTEEKHTQANITEPVSIIMEESKDDIIDKSIDKISMHPQPVFMKRSINATEKSMNVSKMSPASNSKLFGEMILHSHFYISVINVYFLKFSRFCRLLALYARIMLFLSIISMFFIQESV